jgi:NADPH-dependent glutamate synthase beta subunit-like oxidoreductase
VQVEFKDGKLVEVPGTEKEYKADLVLLAMGFVNPVASVLEAFGVDKDARGNAKATPTSRAATPPTCPRCLRPATCAAASRWWSGRSAKAARRRARWTSS